jgi:asparagine synthetase B (glutamine-hydrolysing)
VRSPPSTATSRASPATTTSPASSERQYARLVAGAEHHEILITPQDFIDNFDAMVPHLEEPWQGMGTFGQYMVGKYLAAHGIKVALSGEGSDELFGGYPRLLSSPAKLPDNYQDYQQPDGYPTHARGGARLRLRTARRSARGRRPVHESARHHGRAPFTDHGC